MNEDIKAFPLVPKVIYNDMPVWDGGGIPIEIMDEILLLEEDENIEYYEDIQEDSYSMYKGWWVSFIYSVRRLLTVKNNV